MDNCDEMNFSGKILVCGYGSIGKRHARLLNQMFPRAQVALLRSNLSPKQTPDTFVSDEFFAKQDALDWSPDGVIIASPAPYHVKQALYFASHKIPLLIEKPLGTGLEPPHEVDQLRDFSQKLPILLGYVLRHEHSIDFIKKNFLSFGLGQLIEADFHCASWLPSWRMSSDYRQDVSARRNMGGGVLLELSHEIDLAGWLLGPLTLHNSQLICSGLLDIDVEDQAILVASSKNCLSVTIRLNFCTNPSRRTFTLRGDNGELHCNLLNSTYSVSCLRSASEQFSFSSGIDCKYESQLKHFINCISGLESPICSVDDGIRVVDFVNQARFLVSSS